MANTTYVVQTLSNLPGETVVNDDGSGIDWLRVLDVGIGPFDTRLGETSSYSDWYPSVALHRLRVMGVIENVRGSNLNDNIEGNSLGNLIYGDSGRGLGVDDTITGQAGDDTIYGGGGNDWIGGSADDDLIFGDIGNDTITGGLGADTIEGGRGVDSLEGGNGNAVSDFGDTLTYAASGGGVRVSLTARVWTTGAGGDAQGDRIVGFRNIIGSSKADVLTDTVKTNEDGDEDDNAFFGGDGNDRLYLGGGEDSGEGGSGDDLLRGEAGNDILMGGSNADTVNGGLGRDTLYGGSGLDHFEYLRLGDSGRGAATRDTIADFSSSDGDRIDLSAIDADTTNVGHDAFIFQGAAAFAVGQVAALRVQSFGSGWLVQAEVNGDGLADMSIFVTSATALQATDFIIF